MKRYLLVCIICSIVVPSAVNAQIGVTSHGTTRKFVASKGEGSSFNKPIFIHSRNWNSGVASEYAYVSAHFPGSKPISHSRQYAFSGTFDIITFTTPDGQKRALYFSYRVEN